jgi:polysaccharide pyruvyl transferase WcaK-like protein
MNKILFNGFYGFENTGDDAFVEIASWGNHTYWKNENPAFFSGATLPNTIHKINKIYPSTSSKIIQKLSVFKESLNAYYFINAGGSVFSEIRPFSDIVFAQKAGLLNSKLNHGAIGVSIGPFANSEKEKKVVEYLKTLQFLALRDTESYNYALSLDLDYKPINAFDLAALLPVCYESYNPELSNKNRKVIGISVCNYERYFGGDIDNEKRRNNFIKETISLLSKNSNYYFKFFIFNGNSEIGDEKITHEMACVLNKNQFEIVPYLGDTFKAWKEIKTCDFMLSTRLHASIFSGYANVPFMLVEYHRKCTDFLNDIGYDDDIRVFDGLKDPKETSLAIENILNGQYNVPTNIEETISRAKRNFTEVQL